MCHPRRRKSSQLKENRKTPKNVKCQSIRKGNIPLQELTQKKPPEFSYKRGTGKTHPYKKQQQCNSL